MSIHRVPNLDHEIWSTVWVGWSPDIQSYFIELCQPDREAIVVGTLPKDMENIHILISTLKLLDIPVEQKFLTDLYVDQSMDR